MEAKTYNDPCMYYRKVEKLLLAQEAMNNLALGIAGRLCRHPARADLITVENRGEAEFTLPHTMRNQWVIPACTASDRAVETAVEYLVHNGYLVDRVVGDKKHVSKFADFFTKKTGRISSIHMNQLVYRLDELQPIQLQKGRLKRAGKQDIPLIESWLQSFGSEAGEASIIKDAADLAARMADESSARLWIVDDEPVSMANQSRSTKNGATVNAVYTPDYHKRKGYATSVVWALTEELLKTGFRFCSLYTDSDNPTANSIYQKIGYKPIGESVVYRFLPEQ